MVFKHLHIALWKIGMFLYAQIYWLAEFGDVSCLQFNYLRVETLTLIWEDFVGQFTIDAKALSLAADSCRFTISGAFALLHVCQM
jgi:hypothetical protein